MSNLFQKLVERHAAPGRSSLQPRIPSRFEAAPVGSDSKMMDQGLSLAAHVPSVDSAPADHASLTHPTDRTAHELKSIDSPREIPANFPEISPDWHRRLVAAENALNILRGPLDQDSRPTPTPTRDASDVALPSLDSQPGRLVETIYSHFHHYDLVPDTSPEQSAHRIAPSVEIAERKHPQSNDSLSESLLAATTGTHIVRINATNSDDATKPMIPTLSESMTTPKAVFTPSPFIEPTKATQETRKNVSHKTVLDAERKHHTRQQHENAWHPPSHEAPVPRLFVETAVSTQQRTAPPTIVTDATNKQPEPSNTVHVSIGRILVRSAAPKTETIRQPAPNTSSRVMTLEQYARQRAGGNR